jgi:hypothetical protein
MDEVYEPGSSRSDRLNTKIEVYGKARLKEDILKVFDSLENALLGHDRGINAFQKIVNPGSATNPVGEDFYTVFMAFFDLIIEEDKLPADEESIFEALRGIHDDLEVHSKSKRNRDNNIRKVKGLIEDYFEDTNAQTGSLTGRQLRTKIQNILQRSRTETKLYEVKQGLLTLKAEDRSKKFPTGKVDQICKEAAAIINSQRERESGKLLIGVADNSSDAERCKDVDGIEPTRVRRRHIVGIDREAAALGLSVDEYQEKLISAVKNSHLEDEVASKLVEGLDCPVYEEHSLFVMDLPKISSTVYFNGKIYRRDGASTVEIKDPKEIVEFTKKM